MPLMHRELNNGYVFPHLVVIYCYFSLTLK